MLKDFKPALWILLRFGGIYFLLFLGYQFYLNHYEPMGLDPYSRWIAKQVWCLQNHLGYLSSNVYYASEHTEVFLINNIPVTRMVEGCNAVSIMILCIAFIFAFYKGKKTFLYALFSMIFLHITNVLRIAGINILSIERPEWGDPAHDYLFPAVIYGGVVVLWIVWMKIVLKKTQNNQ